MDHKDKITPGEDDTAKAENKRVACLSVALGVSKRARGRVEEATEDTRLRRTSRRRRRTAAVSCGTAPQTCPHQTGSPEKYNRCK